MIFNRDNRRKIQNFNIDPKAQLRFARPFLVLMVVSFLVINTSYYQIYRLRLAINESSNLEYLAAINGLLSQMIWVSSLGMILLGLLSLLFWIIYSHRVFGPVVQLRRQIENIRNGDFSYRIQLRKTDELKDVADDLNALAEYFSKKK